MFGLCKFFNIMLKCGVVKSDNDFVKWIFMVKMNMVECCDVVISLFNENCDLVMIWKVYNVFLVKVEGLGFKVLGNEVVIEMIEFVYEGLEVQND